MNLNKVLLVGRLTADPIARTTSGGQQVATFSIATNRIWNDKEGSRREDTEYHNIVTWGRQADIVQRFLNKGGMVMVEGRLQTRSWDDKQGLRRKTTEIIAERIQLGPRAFSRPPAGGETSPFVASSPAAAAPMAPPSVPELPTIELDVEESPKEEIKSEDLDF